MRLHPTHFQLSPESKKNYYMEYLDNKMNMTLFDFGRSPLYLEESPFFLSS